MERHQTEKVVTQKVCGIVGGIAYPSSLKYYRLFNEEIGKRLGKLHSSKILMNSLDLEEYVILLRANDYEKVKILITEAATQLYKGGADFLVICSNTAHVAYETIRKQLPDFPILHIGDCCAKEIKKANFKRCGFLGNQLAMERYKQHNLELIVPEYEIREQLWWIIEHELALNIINEKSREFYKKIMIELKEKHQVECIILGCTEISLLIDQSHVSEIPLFDTSLIHVLAAVDVQLGIAEIESFFP